MNNTAIRSLTSRVRDFIMRRDTRTIGRRRKIRPLLSAVVIAGLLSLVLTPHAPASMLSFVLNTEFSGGVPPVGSPPWILVELDDLGGTGSVEMHIEAINLTGDENLARLLMNLDPLLDPTDLTFTLNAKSRVALDTPTILTGVDAFMADGDGKFDITVDFATGGPPDTFVNLDTIDYTIGGIGSLTVFSFEFLSAPAGGYGPFYMAAHVQNTGEGGEFSGWLAGPPPIVPEPSTAVLLAIGACGAISCGVWRRCRRRG